MSKLNKILSIITDILFIVIIISLLVLDIIPNKYILLLSIILLIFGIISTLLAFKTKDLIFKIIILIILLIYILLSILGIYYITNTNKLFNIKDIKEKSIYYVIVNKDSNYKELKDLNNTDMGFLIYNKDYYDKVLNIIKKSIYVNDEKYNDVNKIIDELYNNELSSIVMNSSYYDLIIENKNEFKDKTRIIKEITIDIDNINNNKKGLNEPFNILISGIDTHGNISKVSRSDVNIVISVDPVNNRILLTSIPRDYYVKLHTYNAYDKLTHAGIYGINESMSTIGDLLDIDIDYYIRVNFDTVVSLVDAIGGVDVYSDTSFKTYSGISFNKGTNHLNGKQALAYARERKVFAAGDRKRGEHQEQIIASIINKVSSSKVLLSNYSNIMDSMSNLLQTNISNDDIKLFIKNELDTPSNWEIESISLRGYDDSGYTYSMPGWLLYVMQPEQSSIIEAQNKINKIINKNN